jgi:hypothetical protein
VTPAAPTQSKIPYSWGQEMIDFVSTEIDPTSGNLKRLPSAPVNGHGLLFNSTTGKWEDNRVSKAIPDNPGAGGFYNYATLPALGVAGRNLAGAAIELKARVGVVANPGQNGHLYLESSNDNVNWWTLEYVACRCNLDPATSSSGVVAGGPNIGVGATLQGRIPNQWYYRIRSQAIAPYASPTFIYENTSFAYAAVESP